MDRSIGARVVQVGVACVVTFLFAAYMMLFMVKQTFLFHPHTLTHEMTLSQVPDEIAYARVNCLGDTQLAVYYRREPDYTLPFVLYSHGNMDIVELGSSWMLDSMRSMNIIAYDYRGYGRSDGQPSEYATVMDVWYLLAWIKRTFPTVSIVNDVVLWGRSVGTFVTLACIRDPLRQHLLPRRVFLFTPFARLSDVFDNMGLPLARLTWMVGNMDVSDALKTYCDYDQSRRVLIMGSKCDTVTPFSNSEELASSVARQEQVLLREFYNLHSCFFTYWDVFDEFCRMSSRARVGRADDYEQSDDDEILESLALLFDEGQPQ